MRSRLVLARLPVLLVGLLVALLARPARAAGLALEEPRSGLHLEVEGGCQVKPAPPGDAGAACASFAASAHQAERFAVVLGSDGLLAYSVALFAEPETGTGEERARRVVKALGASVRGEPEVVTPGGQPFLRADLATETGAARVYVAIDDRPEVALVLFASEPARRQALGAGADHTMQTARRFPAKGVPPPTVSGASPGEGRGRTLLAIGLVTLLVAALVLGIVVARRS